jgi:hypothetical protein
MAQVKRKVTKASAQARIRRHAKLLLEKAAKPQAQITPVKTRAQILREYLSSPEGQRKLLEMQRDVLEVRLALTSVQVSVAKTRQALAAI